MKQLTRCLLFAMMTMGGWAEDRKLEQYSAELVKKAAAPPFTNTTHISKDIIIASDPSSFKELSDGGDSVRKVFDRRTSAWAETKVWLFKVVYADRAEPTEVRVNKEFSDVTKARSLALKYAKVVGQLPACLRMDVQTITIHDGKKPCGGGNHGILIHVQQAEMHERDGFLEEVLIHECTHTSLDAVHASDALGLGSVGARRRSDGAPDQPGRNPDRRPTRPDRSRNGCSRKCGRAVLGR